MSRLVFSITFLLLLVLLLILLLLLVVVLLCVCVRTRACVYVCASVRACFNNLAGMLLVAALFVPNECGLTKCDRPKHERICFRREELHLLLVSAALHAFLQFSGHDTFHFVEH